MEYIKTMASEYLLSGIILLLTVVSVIGEDSCPRNVLKKTETCLQSYNTYVGYLPQETKTLYKGVDVETLRNLCSQMRDGLFCLIELKNSCPETEHPNIDTAFSETTSMWQLCNYKFLYEYYAPNQNCFSDLESASSRCHATYDRTVDPLIHSILDGNHGDIVRGCRAMKDMVNCVKDLVENSHKCNDKAVALVEYLVKPSLMYTPDYCVDGVIVTRHPPTTPTTAPAPGHDAQGRHSLNLATQCLPTWRILILPLVSILYTVFFSRTINVFVFHSVS